MRSEHMKYCVYGLGAIGGQIAARLAGAGMDVSAVARADTLRSVRDHGLRFRASGDSAVETHRIPVSDNPRDFAAADCVIVAVKATALPQIADGLASMLAADSLVVSAMNGIPWWFFHRLNSTLDDTALAAVVDPGCRVRACVPPEQVIGAVVHLSSSVEEPGSIRHGAGRRLILGAPGGNNGHATRIGALRDDLTRAGFDVEITERIQQQVWFKLWGNMSINPVSVLTGATVDRIVDDPLLREFVSRCMREADAIGTRLGLDIGQDPDDRLRLTARLGAVRPSMLQDAAAGRPLELDGLVGAVRELGGLLGIATPNIDALFGLARVHARAHGLYPRPADR